MIRQTRSRRALTLIELLIVILIITVLSAITVPAVQKTRESSRRASCRNNLRMLALALHSYHDDNRSLPMGTVVGTYPDVGVSASHGMFVALLNHLDQSPAYNAVNFDLSIYVRANQTVHTLQLTSLLCPSDDSTSRLATYPVPYLDMPAGTFTYAYTNYAACSGIWYHFSTDLDELRRLTAQDNGVAFANSRIHLESIRDGLRHRAKIKSSSFGGIRLDRVIPFAMESSRLEIDLC